MQLKNSAAWIPFEKAQLEVAKAPFPSSCADDELVIQNHAVAINPVDWKIQDSGGFGLTYPAILGSDVVGGIIEVGKDLKKEFKVGQRVMAHAMGIGRGPAYGGFQMYPCLRGETVARIPDDMKFDEAVVMPLSISTAAAGLYMKATLGLEYPTTTKSSTSQESETKKKKSKGTLLLWGGSSSVGSSVIQLAAASGYDVITTASPSNYGYCYKLGAMIVMDYHNPAIVKILTAMLKDRKVMGAYDAIGAESTVKQCAEILAELDGGGKRIASVVSAPEDLPEGVEVVRIGSGNIVNQEPEVAEKVWGYFVPEALKKGVLKTAPEPLVVGKGLQSVQKGLDRQKEGVSAKKVVVVL